MELQLNIIGYLFFVLAGVHIIFPRYFNWKVEFQPVSLINTQMMYVHTFFIGLIVFLMGLLCVFYAPEIVNTPFGQVVSLGLFIFWGTRLIFQLFIYSTKLWWGKKFETAIHVIFSLFWIYLTVTFLFIYLKIAY